MDGVPAVFFDFHNSGTRILKDICLVCDRNLRKTACQFTENPRTVHRKLMVSRIFLRFVSAWAVRIKAIKDEGGHVYDSGNIQTLREKIYAHPKTV